MFALAALPLLALVSAQSSGNASTTDVEYVEANFKGETRTAVVIDIPLDAALSLTSC